MHDIKLIRDNPDAFDAGLAKRGLASQSAILIELDASRRDALGKQQDAETERNTLSKQIGKAKATGDEAEFNRLRGEVDRLKSVLEEAGQQARHFDETLNQHLAALPNLPHDDVPQGADEADNEEVRRWGDPRAMGFKPRDHVDLGEGLGQMDFKKAAEMSGSRFVALRGGLARMERALAQFMLDLHTTEHGYEEVSPPYMVRDEAVFGTGQLPKFSEDLFRTTDHRWLIPTAEVPLTNLARETIHAETDLPMRMTAYTPCFRSEAGSAGRDTRGMIRLHQFQKVEMVSIVAPDESDAELERMTGCAEKVLQLLELPYRVMKLCTGDMGFSARRTFDLEVWMPSQDCYREISSCSTCGDFQARRMDARFRKDGEKRPAFLHTLNGSGVAVGRALVAVLENHQNEDGSISIPAALRPYMGGAETITA
ncbi:serine--tRNA ligase [Maricaulis sp.]|uniref:serine--tRNA ligase n=1 Tax=Maricaulis sp. TaxID=1486257 RepID=UPI0026105C5C|nr:serine--tRNA ligase [Maricaulis sp.]MDF1769617.1 serine--tRNA ligase [Maricaulis sp.]